MLAAQPFGEWWLEDLIARARSMRGGELGSYCNQHSSAHSACSNVVRLNCQRSRTPSALLQSIILRRSMSRERTSFQGSRFQQLGGSTFLQLVELPCGEPVVKENLLEAELRSGFGSDPSLLGRCLGFTPGYSANERTNLIKMAAGPDCFEQDEKLTMLEAIETAAATAVLIGACWAVHVMAAVCVS